jgi:hypothetical protein
VVLAVQVQHPATWVVVVVVLVVIATLLLVKQLVAVEVLRLVQQ